MPILRYLCIALSSALVAAYAALWFAHPAPLEQPHAVIRPPLTVKQQGDELLLWGGWQTVAGVGYPGTNAVEVRCNRVRATCSEAYASLLQHDEGQDLEAVVFEYQVVEWTDGLLHAEAKGAMGDCLDRNLYVSLTDQTASLEWVPQEGCDEEAGAATLVGDPL